MQGGESVQLYLHETQPFGPIRTHVMFDVGDYHKAHAQARGLEGVGSRDAAREE